jgi:hypothetical protein
VKPTNGAVSLPGESGTAKAVSSDEAASIATRIDEWSSGTARVPFVAQWYTDAFLITSPESHDSRDG